jgi:hypothetical protein
MTKEFATVMCDVFCDWQQQPPVYRLYVNNELFTERTFIWTEHYLEEMIQIHACPGKYQIRYEIVKNLDAVLSVRNMRVKHGPNGTHILKNSTLILKGTHEST